MLRVLIIEDEDAHADKLKLYLSRFGEEEGVEFRVTWYGSAVELAETRPVFDLVFLDIRLPGINGMEAAELIRTYDTETPIIFVTDLSQYAVEGYRVNALDFLVKPVEYGDFKMRMRRAMQAIAQSQERSVFVPTRDGLRVLPSRDVVFVEVLNHRLLFHLAGGETIQLRGALGQLEEELGNRSFVRISKSYLVNMRHVRSISGSSVTLSTGETCYVSRSRRKSALAAIADYYGGTA